MRLEPRRGSATIRDRSHSPKHFTKCSNDATVTGLHLCCHGLRIAQLLAHTLLHTRHAMPLTLSELEDIQADLMADDIPIEFDKMSLWTKEQAVAFFETGEEPQAAPGLDVTLLLEEDLVGIDLPATCGSALLEAYAAGRELLATLKDIGVAKLGYRQKLATAVAKLIKKEEAAEKAKVEEAEAKAKADRGEEGQIACGDVIWRYV